MKRSITLLALAASLAACGPSPQPVYQPQAQPQVMYQQPQPQVMYQQPQQPIIQQHDSGVGTALAAGVAGAVVGGMLANSANNNRGGAYDNTPPQTVVNKTVINKTYIQGSPAAPATVAVVPIPAAKPSFITPVPAPVVVAKPVPAPTPSFAPKTTYAQSAPPKVTHSSSSSFARPSSTKR